MLENDLCKIPANALKCVSEQQYAPRIHTRKEHCRFQFALHGIEFEIDFQSPWQVNKWIHSQIGNDHMFYWCGDMALSVRNVFALHIKNRVEKIRHTRHAVRVIHACKTIAKYVGRKVTRIIVFSMSFNSCTYVIGDNFRFGFDILHAGGNETTNTHTHNESLCVIICIQ